MPQRMSKEFLKATTAKASSPPSLEVLSQVLASYEELQAAGHGELGTQALIKYYEEGCAEDDE